MPSSKQTDNQTVESETPGYRRQRRVTARVCQACSRRRRWARNRGRHVVGLRPSQRRDQNRLRQPEDWTARRLWRRRPVRTRPRAQGIGQRAHQSGGKKYKVEIIDRDSQSDPSRASQLAKALINSDKVDLMLTTSTPEVVNPVSDACEAAGVPVRLYRPAVGSLVFRTRRASRASLHRSSGHTTSRSASRNSPRPIFRSGATGRCRPTRRSASCSPTMPTATHCARI